MNLHHSMLGARPNPVFTLPVTGGGTATVTLHLDGTLSNGTLCFTATQVNWRFDASPSPTPEPASMLLLGTGLAGVLFTRRARGSGRSSLPGRAQRPLREGDE